MKCKRKPFIQKHVTGFGPVLLLPLLFVLGCPQHPGDLNLMAPSQSSQAICEEGDDTCEDDDTIDDEDDGTMDDNGEECEEGCNCDGICDWGPEDDALCPQECGPCDDPSMANEPSCFLDGGLPPDDSSNSDDPPWTPRPPAEPQPTPICGATGEPCVCRDLVSPPFGAFQEAEYGFGWDICTTPLSDGHFAFKLKVLGEQYGYLPTCHDADGRGPCVGRFESMSRAEIVWEWCNLWELKLRGQYDYVSETRKCAVCDETCEETEVCEEEDESTEDDSDTTNDNDDAPPENGNNTSGENDDAEHNDDDETEDNDLDPACDLKCEEGACKQEDHKYTGKFQVQRFIGKKGRSEKEELGYDWLGGWEYRAGVTLKADLHLFRGAGSDENIGGYNCPSAPNPNCPNCSRSKYGGGFGGGARGDAYMRIWYLGMHARFGCFRCADLSVAYDVMNLTEDCYGQPTVNCNAGVGSGKFRLAFRTPEFGVAWIKGHIGCRIWAKGCKVHSSGCPEDVEVCSEPNGWGTSCWWKRR